MAREINRLSARFASTTKEAGRHADGGGLYLIVKPSGARAWAFIFKREGKWREMGVGAAEAVSLARARELAAEARALIAAGLDPIEERRKAAVPKAAIPTFREAAIDHIEGIAPKLKNAKHVQQWKTTLGVEPVAAKMIRIDAKVQARHEAALNKLLAMKVSEIETADVLAVLSPIWHVKPETASRLRGRIEAVLSATAALGHRSEVNPARWRGHMERLLTKPPKMVRGHHAAMAYEAVPAFIAKLAEARSVSAHALHFAILTAARSGEVLGARWSEIDMEAAVWTVPAARMKAKRVHRVPLAEPALAILRKMAEVRDGDFVFPGQRPGSGLSVMALEMALRRLGETVTVHGFRSTFRDWLGEETTYPAELAEAALAHVIADKAVAAYRRGDALERRREMMVAWASFIEPAEAGDKVISLRRKIVQRAA
ncbi:MULTISPECIES: site-specific integrase [Hyphomicrobiales]|jgi:integrase|uniref:tyrosine-type recombinase/integrase n=1 Tax=Methylobacterium sp. CCH7-A2 TaxID=1768789 RepID=UPI000830E765|nr:MULTISPECIES: site-specific integrase [Hyphomicrobiales]